MDVFYNYQASLYLQQIKKKPTDSELILAGALTGITSELINRRRHMNPGISMDVTKDKCFCMFGYSKQNH